MRDSFTLEENLATQGYLNAEHAQNNAITARRLAIRHSNAKTLRDARNVPKRDIATTTAAKPS
jgi:hypothetical protein